MKGFFGLLLRVDLTHQSYQVEEIPGKVLKTYFGGKGLGTYLMLELIPPGIDPLSEENKLIFTTGSATDSKIPASSRYGVFSKSPLTHFYGESYSGGSVAPQLSRTGFDAIVFVSCVGRGLFRESNISFCFSSLGERYLLYSRYCIEGGRGSSGPGSGHWTGG